MALQSAADIAAFLSVDAYPAQRATPTSTTTTTTTTTSTTTTTTTTSTTTTTTITTLHCYYYAADAYHAQKATLIGKYTMLYHSVSYYSGVE